MGKAAREVLDRAAGGRGISISEGRVGDVPIRGQPRSPRYLSGQPVRGPANPRALSARLVSTSGNVVSCGERAATYSVFQTLRPTKMRFLVPAPTSACRNPAKLNRRPRRDHPPRCGHGMAQGIVNEAVRPPRGAANTRWRCAFDDRAADASIKDRPAAFPRVDPRRGRATAPSPASDAGESSERNFKVDSGGFDGRDRGGGDRAAVMCCPASSAACIKNTLCIARAGRGNPVNPCAIDVYEDLCPRTAVVGAAIPLYAAPLDANMLGAMDALAYCALRPPSRCFRGFNEMAPGQAGPLFSFFFFCFCFFCFFCSTDLKVICGLGARALTLNLRCGARFNPGRHRLADESFRQRASSSERPYHLAASCPPRWPGSTRCRGFRFLLSCRTRSRRGTHLCGRAMWARALGFSDLLGGRKESGFEGGRPFAAQRRGGFTWAVEVTGVCAVGGTMARSNRLVPAGEPQRESVCGRTMLDENGPVSGSRRSRNTGGSTMVEHFSPNRRQPSFL